MTLFCWLNLAKQVIEQAEFLRWAGEGLQLTADQAQLLEKMAALEKSSREQSEKVRLLEAQVVRPGAAGQLTGMEYFGVGSTA